METCYNATMFTRCYEWIELAWSQVILHLHIYAALAPKLFQKNAKRWVSYSENIALNKFSELEYLNLPKDIFY